MEDRVSAQEHHRQAVELHRQARELLWGFASENGLTVFQVAGIFLSLAVEVISRAFVLEGILEGGEGLNGEDEGTESVEGE